MNSEQNNNKNWAKKLQDWEKNNLPTYKQAIQFLFDLLSINSVQLLIVVSVILLLWTDVFEDKTKTNLATVLTAIFGLLGIYASISSDKALGQLRNISKQITETLAPIRKVSTETQESVSSLHLLSKQIRGDVLRIKDESYIPLTGFAELFAKELWLLKQAKQEIWYLSFLSVLGYPHLCNPQFRTSYNQLQTSNLKIDAIPDDVEQACNEFYQCILEKITSIPRIKIMVYDDDGLGEFFGKLKRIDPCYQNLEEGIIKQKEQEFIRTIDQQKVDYSSQEGAQRPKFEQKRIIPLHFLITQIEQGEDNNAGKWGCVVYIVNKDIIGKLDEIEGFYTEDIKLIKAYKEIAQVLLGN